MNTAKNSSEVARLNMVERQIRSWEVLDPQVLNVIKSLDRADFVKDDYKSLAYADCQIPCGAHAQMLPPVVQGRLLQALHVRKNDSILEIGSGSGYLTSCLAILGGWVLSVDISEENLVFARHNTARLGLCNITFEAVNGLSCEYQDCYDAIAVTGSVEAVPENLKRSLKPGGRLFIIEGRSPLMQALLITRSGDNAWICQSLFETDLPALQTAHAAARVV